MKKAVWIIGHGSSKQEWVDQVDNEVARISTDLPIILSFLEKVEGRLIADGMEQLKKIGAEDVLVIPLFVSSASTHIAEIQDILFSYQDIKYSYTPCMDDHDLVIEYIIREANNLVKLANQSGLSKDNSLTEEQRNNEYTLFLIAHGSDEAEYQEKWQQILKSIVHKIELVIDPKSNFKQIEFGTFLPYTIENKLKDIERTQRTGHTLIVIPLFLSTGIFTNKKIPQILSNYLAKYRNIAYLNPSSNPWVHQWIKCQIDAFQSH